MAWLYLIIAGMGEVLGVMAINQLNKRRSISNLLLLIAGFAVSFLCLTIAMESIPMGTAYAIWTGIGTVGSALIGMLLFGESRDRMRLFFIALVICAVIGLKLIA